MNLDFLTPPSPEPADEDPRIDPRVMWPLEYLRVHQGFSVADSPVTRLHGDVLRVELVRGRLRVLVTWVPATEQVFVTRGQELLGVFGGFRELVDGLERLSAGFAVAA